MAFFLTVAVLNSSNVIFPWSLWKIKVFDLIELKGILRRIFFIQLRKYTLHINIFVNFFLLLAMHFFCIYAFYFNGDLFYWTLTTENLGCFQSQSDSRVSIVSLCVMLIQCIKNQALSSVIKHHQASSSILNIALWLS